ncbi:hypothetical protein BCAR13_10154 [Paraburkholderia caribensis]|nr:hypothetical protein BCAR13_10154 [Paraburkholderia caribensis]
MYEYFVIHTFIRTYLYKPSNYFLCILATPSSSLPPERSTAHSTQAFLSPVLLLKGAD